MGEGWHRESLPPDEQVLREQLESDTAFQTLLPLQRTVEESLEAGETAVLDVVAKNNAIRQTLFDTFVTRKGSARAKISYDGIEGGRFTDYIIIEDGRVTVVHDASGDRPVSGGIHSYEIDRIDIGYHQRNSKGVMQFQPVKSATPERGKPLTLRYQLPSGVEEFF